MADRKYRVLFLASWYPCRNRPVFGIFIKRHAIAASRFSEVSVLHVALEDDLKGLFLEVESGDDGGIFTVTVYLERLKARIPFLTEAVHAAKYLIGYWIGLNIIKMKFGRPDFVHANVVIPAGIMALAIKYLKGIDYVVTEQSTAYCVSAPKDERLSLAERIIVSPVLKKSRAVIAVSDYLRKEMLRYGMPLGGYVVPNIVDASLYYPGEGGHARAKKRALHVSLIDRRKNLPGILRAIRQVSLKRRDFEFYVIGDGAERREAERCALEMGLKDRYVYFLGLKRPSEVARIMRSFDFLIMNSSCETFSVAAAEAVSSGLPVITTRCGGPEEFIKDDIGICVERDSEKELEAAIVFMLDNCHMYDKGMLHGYAKERFGFETVSRKLFDVYNRTFPFKSI